MTPQQTLHILYDLVLSLLGEHSSDTLSRHFLQRLLYHTGFAVGMLLERVEAEAAAPGQATMRLRQALGNRDLQRRLGLAETWPAMLVEGETSLLDAMPDQAGLFHGAERYHCVLRLQLDDGMLILLLAPAAPARGAAMLTVLSPVLPRFRAAYQLCLDNEQRAERLQASLDERARAAGELQDSEQRLRALLQFQPLATLVADVASGKVVMFSAKARDLLGFSHEDIPTLEAWWLHVFPDAAYRRRVRLEWEAAVAKAGHYLGRAALLMATVACQDRSKRVVEFHIKPVRGSLMVSMVDITAYHRQEEMLRKAKEAAEEASQVKSRFLSSMSHEVRTPLNAIMGYAQLLGMDSNLNPQQQASLREITRAGGHLLGLINNVLDLARLEAEPPHLDWVDVSLSELLGECRAALEPLARERRVRLEVADLRGIRLRADRQRLAQVLQNLLANAIQFNHEGGRVGVRSLPAAAGHFRLAVEDTGPGIAAEKLHRLFEPFDRLGAEHGSVHGSGIGLVIAKKLVEYMGGILGVDSQPGSGSSFWVELPLAAGEAAEATGVAAEAAGPRILVAEDNPANQLLIKMQLKKLGYQADVADNGLVALEMWRAGHHALLLTDCAMPMLDGYGLAAAIRAEEAGSAAHLPIVACTAHAREEVLEQAQAAGMDDYLAKPIGMEALAAMVEKWLQRTAPDVQRGLPQAPAPTSAAAAVDYLAALRQIMGGDVPLADALGLLQACSEAVQTGLEEGRAAQASANSEAFSKAMHKLKASVRMIGADRLAELVQRLETAARAADWPVIHAGMPELEAEAAALGIELKALSVVEAEPGVPAPTPVAAMPNLARLSVMVVDDDPLIRSFISGLLTRKGIDKIHLAADGMEALKLLIVRGGTIDVVLCDLNMPGMDGVELIRHIGELDYKGSIVFISGEDSRVLSTVNELAQSHGLTTLGVLEKPFKAEQLYDLLGQYRPGRLIKKTAPAEAQEVTAEEIRLGLQNDEFTMYLQPKVDAHTLQVVGAEALARWQRPKGLVSPGLFIPVAEANGLIDPLFQQVFAKTVQFGSRLHAAGHKLSLAVNVSAVSLSSLNIPEFVINEAHRHGFDPAYLVLEVTESGLLRDMRAALDVLTRLRLKRVNLSIDDFGTGYASMDQLRRIPFGELKIDRSFVGGALKDTAARSILESSVDMARKMGLKIVAEGVENEAELELVRSLGCDLVQGFHIARPMDMERFLEWVKQA